MRKHTQEEWVVEPDGDHLMVCTDLLEICTIQPVDRGGVKSFYFGDETIANARLIASAPDLLSDLEEAAATLRRYEALHRAKNTEESTAKAEVNAALANRFETTIAKAKGEQA